MNGVKVNDALLLVSSTKRRRRRRRARRLSPTGGVARYESALSHRSVALFFTFHPVLCFTYDARETGPSAAATLQPIIVPCYLHTVATRWRRGSNQQLSFVRMLLASRGDTMARFRTTGFRSPLSLNGHHWSEGQTVAKANEAHCGNGSAWAFMY